MFASWVYSTIPMTLVAMAIVVAYHQITVSPIPLLVCIAGPLWMISGVWARDAQPHTLRQSLMLLIRRDVWGWPLFLARDHTKTAEEKGALLRAMGYMSGGVILVALVIEAPSLASLPPIVQLFHSLVMVTGMLLIAANVMWGWIAQPYSVSGQASLALWRVGLLLLSSALIRSWGDSIATGLTWLHAHPGDALVGATPFLFVFILFRIRIPTPHGRSACDMASSTAIPGMPPSLTYRDRKIIAVHEAGHAMVYAGLRPLPPGIRVVMGSDPHTASLGYVTGVAWQHVLPSSAFSAWRMHCYLAGYAAERALLGENALGTISDMQAWQTEAHCWLAAGCGDFYYASPHNAAEAANNQRTLETLRSRQMAVLKKFFEANRALLTEFADTVRRQGVVEGAQLEALLERVVCTEGLPVAMLESGQCGQ